MFQFIYIFIKLFFTFFHLIEQIIENFKKSPKTKYYEFKFFSFNLLIIYNKNMPNKLKRSSRATKQLKT